MGVEIERKFLVTSEAWREKSAPGKRYRQGYLSVDKERTVRVRTQGEHGWITVKGLTVGAVRAEYEYPIPLADAEEMLDRLCRRPLVEKTRHCVSNDGLTWEVDVFAGENQGLVMAEVELPTEDHPLSLPPWVGSEVTHDPRYYNANLSQVPFKRWA